MPTNLESIVDRLKHVLAHPAELPLQVPQLQKLIWEGPTDPKEESPWEALRDLAYDLDYYQPDPRIRSTDKGLFGEERAIAEIKQAIDKLAQQGNK